MASIELINVTDSIFSSIHNCWPFALRTKCASSSALQIVPMRCFQTIVWDHSVISLKRIIGNEITGVKDKNPLLKFKFILITLV